MKKTNAMRILEHAGIAYRARSYDANETNGEKVAVLLGEAADRVFKTLVTVADQQAHFVFLLPVAHSLDMKKAAAAVGVKALAMIRQKDLQARTGYVHGGCSPVGMKKPFATVVDASCLRQETIFVNAGRRGTQLEIRPDDLIRLVGAQVAVLTQA